MGQNRFAAGLVIGVLCGWLSDQIPFISAAPAQVGQAVEVQRYRISSWAAGYSTTEKHGAYIIDTRTGVVWLAEGQQKPVNIGALTR